MSSNQLLIAALWHASQGRYVFPVGDESKKPITDHAFLDATIDTTQITRWWADHPDANIGLACRMSGLLVIDVDPDHGGDQTLAALERELGALPRAVHQRSGSGGSHIVMRDPSPGDQGWTRNHDAGGSCRGKLGPGIDVKNNGYVLVEPSRSSKGAYTWLASDWTNLPEVPEAWQAKLKKEAPEPRAAGIGAWERPAGELSEADADRLLHVLTECKRGHGTGQTFRAIKTIFHDYGRALDEEGRALVALWNDCYSGVPHSNAELERQIERIASRTHDHPRGFAVGAAASVASIVGLKPASRGPGVKTHEAPTIRINDAEQERVVREAIDALRALDAQSITVRGSRLVRVLRNHGKPDWRERPDGTPFIAELPKPILRGLMERSAHWKRWKKGKKDEPGEWAPSPVPDWAVEMVSAMGEWPLPQLEGISSVPVFSIDGSIQETPGYDPKTRKIYDPQGTVFPPIPERPTRADAQRSMASLLEPFDDFPFVQPCHRAAVAAAILTVAARTCFDAAPAFPISAPKAGSGKSLIAKAIFMLITGNKMVCSPFTESLDEWRKRLLVLALENPEIWVIDNINAPFGNGVIDQVLTTGFYGDRLLGKSESASGMITSVWFPNGNNLQYRGDTVRRTIPINVDPELENPEYRSGFKHPDLIGYVARERPRLIVDALTILRAYVQAGMPAHGKAPKGSFEDWDRLIRGAVIWAGEADPEEATLAAREDGVDEEADNLGVLLAAWENVFGRNAVSIADVIKKALKPMSGMDYTGEAKARVELYEALKPYGTDKSGNFNPSLIPQRMKQIKGQVKAGKKLIVEKTISKVAQWAIVEMKTAQNAGRSREATERREGPIQAHDLEKSVNRISGRDEAVAPAAGDQTVPHLHRLPHSSSGASRIESALAIRGETLV